MTSKPSKGKLTVDTGFGVDGGLKNGEVLSEMDDYDKTFDQKDLKKRSNYAQLVTVKFYNLITDMYEYAWGESFHFAPRHKGESFPASIARHEHYLSQKLGLKEGDNVLDVGCGIMGPAREIARFSGATITGLNLNEYQLKRCAALNSREAFSNRLKTQHGDFMNIPFPDNTFDKIYAIEALCHAPDRAAVYKEICTKLKPGGLAAFYEWGTTDLYDPNNARHAKAKHMIEYGNSICELQECTEPAIKRDLAEAGFELVEATDLAAKARSNGNEIPWYATLEGGCSIQNIRHSRAGRMFTSVMVSVLEKFHIAAPGTARAHQILTTAADGLVIGGVEEFFTPMYLVIARKPE